MHTRTCTCAHVHVSHISHTARHAEIEKVYRKEPIGIWGAYKYMGGANIIGLINRGLKIWQIMGYGWVGGRGGRGGDGTINTARRCDGNVRSPVAERR